VDLFGVFGFLGGFWWGRWFLGGFGGHLGGGFGGWFCLGFCDRRKDTATLDAGGVFNAIGVCGTGRLVSCLAKPPLKGALDEGTLFFIGAIVVFFAEAIVSGSSDKIADAEALASRFGVGGKTRFVAKSGCIGGVFAAL
jgi:hypothetical protein